MPQLHMLIERGTRRMRVLEAAVDQRLKGARRGKRGLWKQARLVRTSLIVIGLSALGAAEAFSQAIPPKLAPMPLELETRFALSALPATLRGAASVYLLDPKEGRLPVCL